MKKLLLLSTAFLPLCFHSPYLFQAWSSSRLDHWDWIFYLLSIPAAVWALHKEKFGKCDFYALLLLLPMLFLTVSSSIHHINALAVASAAGVLFAAVWLLGSWPTAYKALPSAGLLLLGTPSSSYQLSLLLMCSVNAAWAVKFLLAVLCFLWIWCNKRCGMQLKSGTVFFSAAAAASCFLLLHTKELYFEGASFIPEFPSHCGDFWGRSILPDENTKRFFATGTVRQYRYTKNDTDISVLAVKCGKDIHEIHPASHCLRTSMWTVNSETITYLQENFAVTEIDAAKGGSRILVWVWYSSDKFSTPTFLGFRRHFTPGGNYHTYQISVPVYGSVEAGRKGLQNFIQALKGGKQQ
ncbi:MAG: exosortase-associated EpsI family protein [Lentisphaeria bacterium]|nr:exosortase-associated EpsI family protein [Lentisphaeria bacterium]